MFNWKVNPFGLRCWFESVGVKYAMCYYFCLFIFCVYSSIHVIGSFFVLIEFSHLANWNLMLCNVSYGILPSLYCIRLILFLYSRHPNRLLFWHFISHCIEIHAIGKCISQYRPICVWNNAPYQSFYFYHWISRPLTEEIFFG